MQAIKLLIGLTFLFSLFSYNAFSAESHNQFIRKSWTMNISIHSNDFAKDLKTLGEMDLDIAGVDVKNQIIDLLINEFDYKNLINLGYEISISETKGVTSGPDDDYKNPEEIEELVKDFHNKFPDITNLVSIGKSLEGRDIWALKISDNPNQNETNEPAVLFNSMHHAREVMTPEVSIDIIEYLLTNYNSNAEVRDWVDSTEIWVIPMFNVDGNNKMWNHDSWWRKNTRGGFGVDLNRNYPSGWGSCNGSSGSQSSQTYRGEAPGSEPETQVMMNFIAKVRPVFDISYHSYSEIVIFPFGCKDKRTQTKEVVEKIGHEIGNLVGYKAGTAWELLYNADGGDIDWMYEAYQVIPYVIEVNSRSQGFHPKFSRWRDKTVELNRAGWQHLLKRTHTSGFRAMVYDDAGIPLKDFTVKVYRSKNGQKELFQDYLGHQTGIFHLVLNPGLYEFEIIKDGKMVKTIQREINDKLEFESINL